jgi:DNA-binding Xre family transcriptional regulator
MKQVQHTNCFARQCLGHQKDLIARELRKIVRDNSWTQKKAAEIMKVSENIVGFINRGEEWRVSFDTLYVAAICAGLTINLGVVVPN